MHLFSKEYELDFEALESPYFVTGDLLDNKNFSGFGFNLTLKRHSVPYLWTYFFPTLAAKLIVGVSFVIPPTTAIPGRLTLLVTVLMVQMEILRDVEALFSGSDSLTAMTVYVLSSIFCILAALTEYALILLTDRLRKRFGYQIFSYEKIDFASLLAYFTGIAIFHFVFIEMYVF